MGWSIGSLCPQLSRLSAALTAHEHCSAGAHVQQKVHLANAAVVADVGDDGVFAGRGAASVEHEGARGGGRAHLGFSQDLTAASAGALCTGGHHNTVAASGPFEEHLVTLANGHLAVALRGGKVCMLKW